MHNYKETLNLPTTDFPMRASLSQREPEMLQYWEQHSLYTAIRQAKKGRPRFILHDGPPYANGDTHVGHAVNKTLKDIIVKSKGLSGFDAPYIPGWDCHGLPIELKVEQQAAKTADVAGVASFHQRCRDYATLQIERQKSDFVRLGVLADWQHPYLTMDFATEANTLRVLATILANGHLYRGIKPVHWCTVCQSALAEAELEYHEKSSLALDVRFLAVDSAAVEGKFSLANRGIGQLSAVIWTTTPWTLPANRALAFNPEACYQLIQVSGEQPERLIVAAERVDALLTRWNLAHWQVLGSCRGAELAGVRFQHPFYPFDVPAILGDHVTTAEGSGIVHTAPGHGPEDFTIGQRYGLEVASPVDATGCYLPGHDPLVGLSIFEADATLVALLQQHGALGHQEKIQHSYPHCWRHQTPVIFRTTHQWFISMAQQHLRTSALQQIKTVDWIPAWGAARIRSMIEQRPDWCISRQRTWGIPIALFVHKQSGQPHPRSIELLEQVAQRVEQHGISAWWALEATELLAEEAQIYEKVNDILDVWFDSGATYATVVASRAAFGGAGADLYLEGSDQHRGWFMSSLMLATASLKKAPYRQVLTHGFTVDAQGRKMSKSLGNVISTKRAIERWGADILRLWVAATDYRAEIVFSEAILKSTSDLYRRIRNTARFLLANLKGFEPQHHLVAPEKMVLLDQWAVGCAQQAQAVITPAYARYDFHAVVQRLMHFCSIEMGSFYLDIIKDRQYTAQRNSLARRSCQTALYHIAEALVRWIAPILSFTADEIWRHLPGDRSPSVFTEMWYEGLAKPAIPSHPILDDRAWSTLVTIRQAVNGVLEQARLQKLIGSSLAAEVILYVQPPWAEVLLALQDELHFLLITSAASVVVVEKPTTDSDLQATSLEGVHLKVLPARGRKCPRCWHYTAGSTEISAVVREEANTIDQSMAALCDRCVTNVTGVGETRRFV